MPPPKKKNLFCGISADFGLRRSVFQKTFWPKTATSVATRVVGFSGTRQTSRAPSAKRREVFGESNKG